MGRSIIAPEIQIMHPDKIDRSKLTGDDCAILADFEIRRKAFDQFIRNNSIALCICPVCGYPTLEERGAYDICDVCRWEDDDQDDESADEIWGGPNSDLSLTQNRINIGRALNLIAESIDGEINNNPAEVISILRNHVERMKIMYDRISPTTDISDPLWTEWQKETNKILVDLIKQK
jgi:hypothetical protein